MMVWSAVLFRSSSTSNFKARQGGRLTIHSIPRVDTTVDGGALVGFLLGNSRPFWPVGSRLSPFLVLTKGENMPINPDAGIVRRKTLPAQECAICKKKGPVTRTGACEECSICIICRRYVIASLETRACKFCVCSNCKRLAREGEKLLADYDMSDKTTGHRNRLCTECFVKKYGQINCISCNERPRMFFVASEKDRHPKLPNTCEHCLMPHIKTKICYFCGSQAYDVMQVNDRLGQGAVCAACAGTQSCFKGKCTPSTPCKNCQAMIADPDEFVNTIYFHSPLELERYAARGPQKYFIRSRRLISAEIEVIGVKSNGDLAHNIKLNNLCRCEGCARYRVGEIAKYVKEIGGSFVHDESIPHGFEINMPPAAGDNFINLTTKMSDKLYELGGYVTEKCGTHIHVSASDYTPLDMKKLLMLYCLIEPAILWTQPSSRVLKEKSHCFPCAKKYRPLFDVQPNSVVDIKKLINALLYQGQFGRPPRFMRGNNRTIKGRYDFMNIHSWNHRGTIEIRGHAGTVDADKIINWGAIWTSILDNAIKMSEREIRSLQSEQAKTILIHLTPSDTHPYLINRWTAFEKTYEGKQY
jgi:hypothetical protein